MRFACVVVFDAPDDPDAAFEQVVDAFGLNAVFATTPIEVKEADAYDADAPRVWEVTP